MDLLALALVVVLATALSFWPVVAANRAGRSVLPWIVGGLLLGPLNALLFVVVRATRGRHASLPE